MKRYHILAFCLLLLASCTDSNRIEIVNKNFGDEIGQLQNLLITFDTDLHPDSLLDVWDTIAYIKFTPDVPGKFKWTSTRELVFSPSSGFAAATDYSAELTPELLNNAKGKRLPEKSAFSFHTPYLSLVSSEGYWTTSEKIPGSAQLLLMLTFNYRVDPSVLAPLLEIRLNDREVSYQPFSTQADKKVIIALDGLPKESVSEAVVNLTIKTGLKTTESAFMTKEETRTTAAIPSPDKLEIVRAEAMSDAGGNYIRVITTQKPELAGASKLISVDPKVQFTVQPSSNGFQITGDFQSGNSYQLSIGEQLAGALGGTLSSAFVTNVSFTETDPVISFSGKNGLYLSSKSSRNVAVNISGIPKVNVRVWKVYENNIIHYLHTGRYNEGWYDDEGNYSNDGSYQYNTYDMGRTGDLIFNRDYNTKDLAKLKGSRLINLTFDDQTMHRGIYLVRVSSSEDQWIHATRLVSVSDIGMIVRETANEIHVFANSISDASPVNDLSVQLISTNNQVMMQSKTNSQGVAVFQNVKSKAPGFSTAMVTARNKDDFNYLMLSDTRVNNSRFDVGGRRVNKSGLMAFIYGDRNIYRPGETVHLNTIVRDEMWNRQQGLPVKLKVVRPDGKTFRSFRADLNRQGAYSVSLEIPDAAPTGSYTAELQTANDVLIQSYQFSVEEFMPDRIDVKMSLSKNEMKDDDTITVSLIATNLFGPPAAGRKYEMDYSVQRRVFHAEKFRGYSFVIKSENNLPLHVNDVREGVTDAQGKASQVFGSEKSWADQGMLQANVFSTVFDETGRPVNRSVTFPVYTQDIFFGIKINDMYASRGQRMNIPLIAVDKNGIAIDAEAHIQVVRYDWYTSIERDQYGGRVRYVSKKKEVVIADKQINLPASGQNFIFTPNESGEYEVRLRRPGTATFVSDNFYSYGYGYTANTSFEVNSEGEVDIQADKESYMTGETAKLIFKAPFNGKMLVCIEGENLYEYKYITTDNRSAFMEIPLKDSHLPNVYVTATVFRALDDGSIPVTVGHGFKSLKVEKSSTKLPVTIVAAEKSRSSTKQTIKVKTIPSAGVEMTIAVVDEGILALKNYETPSPHGYFYQKKALMVNSYDVYAMLLPDLVLKRPLTGGDMSAEVSMSKRNNPLANNRVKLVSSWSGILQTNAAGEATYTMDIPQFSGDLRVMACVYHDKAFGSADHHIKVADPVVISPSIPRFLSPRDSLIMPVTLTNTTAQTMNASATLAVNGPLRITGEKSVRVSIPPNSEKKVDFTISSEAEIGEGRIDVSVKTPSETFNNRTDITIRPSSGLVKRSGSGDISGSGTISLKHDLIPSTAEARLVITQNPAVEFGRSLSYLLAYPYGCVEQTVSAAFPQLYFTDLVKSMKVKGTSDLSPQANVNAAIRKLEGMQLYNGAMSYWPGGDHESWWGSAYALHFLAEARKAGFDVNPNVIDKLLMYVGKKSKSHLLEDEYRYYSETGAVNLTTIYKKENFYSLFLMALYGKADMPLMNFYKASQNKLSLDSRYMLACAYLAAGDRQTYSSILPSVFSGERSAQATGGSFYSYLRDQALVLNVLLDTDRDNPQIPSLIRELSRQLKQEKYPNTQEAAFSFLALGKFARSQPQNKISATIRPGSAAPVAFRGDDVTLTKGIAGNDVNVQVDGNGRLYYFWEIEGLSSTGDVKEEDSFISVRKTFMSRSGQPLASSTFRQGDLVVVRLNVRALTGANVENVVITDILPAGFEIENPRIGEVRELSWITNQSGYDYMDVRDDRIHFFTTVTATEKYFYYLVRAVSTGTFRMGHVSADAMYNGEYHSYHGAGTVTVLP